MKRTLLVALATLCAIMPLGAAAARRTDSTSAGHTAIASQLALAQRDQQNLAQARPGERDLYDLTRRLKLHSLTPISPYVRATTPTYDVGHVETFWIAQASSGFFSAKATLMLKTAHAYWYVQNGMGIPQDKLLAGLRISANDFETKVYPTDHMAFGQEWEPGPNHDPRLTILNANLPGVAGYYSAEDLYPAAVNAYSNQRKMLYVNILDDPLGTPQFAETIAHEFQHMIHWYQHQRDDTWINEGSSVLAQVINGYTASYFDQGFASAPGTQLDNFCYGAPECSDDSSYAHYGAGFLWMYYLYQHYGGDKALHALLADKGLSGMTLFDDVLARLGSKDTARDMFRKWVIANLVDDPTIYGGIYGYQHTYNGCCIHAATTVTGKSFPLTRHGRVNQFATDYVDLRPAGATTLHLQFTGDPTVRIVANTPLQDGVEWWSNRGDEMDSTLTRAVDLSSVHHATLQYDIWYDIERDFDYGYVEASVDGGRTWTTLRGQHTTNADPNGANYGNGYTGASVSARGNDNGWLHETVDLSSYAGKRISIRFEHITDDAYNASGYTLDNIRIPEIGFADGRSTTGWQTGGWVRVANLLPTRWLVQLVLYTSHGVEVRQVPLATDATGQATISGLGKDVQRVVVAISPTAVQTTIPSNYTLTVQ